MSRATVTTFGRGVSFVASGETGTQANEFEAAIKSVTSATTVGAVFVYDTRNDSDGGAWRKKCAGLSWYDEDLNTATRGGRREFPSVALIVADNESAEETLTIYDLDDPAMPIWMQFLDAGALTWSSGSPRTLNAITALNGRVYIGWQDGLLEFNFAEDDMRIGFSSAYQLTSGRDIASRNVTSTSHPSGDGYVIANSTVNDVAATIVEGSELDALGLVRPVVACATAGGVSVIHPNGDVYDKATTSAAATLVKFDKDGNLYAGQGQYISRFDLSTLYADASTSYLSAFENNGTLVTIREFANASIPSLVGSVDSLAITDNGFAGGSSSGLTQVKFNDGDHEDSAVAYITSVYNSGYLLGDIRGAFLMGDRTADRSVKGNTLTLNQASGSDTVDAEKVDGASGTADLYGYKSFSASNYLSRASNTDFDFGTGDFSIMFWVKDSNTTEYSNYMSRSDASLEAGDWLIQQSGAGLAGQLVFYVATPWASKLASSAGKVVSGAWTHVVLTRRSGTLYWYFNGKADTSASYTGSLSPTSAFTIGHALGESVGPADNSSLSLVRLSATAPTPQQVADIYRQEAPLFRAGAKCLLQTGASATTNVQDLAYDSSTDLLTVGTGAANAASAGATIFRGLEAVDTFKGQDYGGWSTGTLTKVASNGGVSVYYRGFSTGGLVLDLPAIDVRGDLNTADSKLPDDGKFHFSGVTTNATPTVIGQIPIAEDEQLYIKSVVNAGKYRAKTSERASFEVDAQFVRKIGDDVNSPTELRKLSDETYSQTFDVVWERDTASNTARLKVTGVAGMRFEWSADITVQRISEKTYER